MDCGSEYVYLNEADEDDMEEMEVESLHQDLWSEPASQMQAIGAPPPPPMGGGAPSFSSFTFAQAAPQQPLSSTTSSSSPAPLFSFGHLAQQPMGSSAAPSFSMPPAPPASMPPPSSPFAFGGQLPPAPPASMPPPPASLFGAQKKLRKVRQVDTNVVSINFGSLLESAQIATGDVISCTGCSAVFSAISEMTPVIGTKEEGDSALWKCEFCGTENQVNLDPEEMPTAQNVDYIIGAPSEAVTAVDENLVLFVIDISGSMCVSYEIEGSVKLKGSEKMGKLAEDTEEFQEKTASGRVADQFMPNERRDITYITRLQCVQAAIASEMDRMYKENPNRKVGLITFNNEVNIVGDGTQQVQTITGDKLNSYDALFQAGSAYQLSKNIKESKEGLHKKLFSLEESGSTALGPALVVAMGIASQKAGSKVILCTDGLSNVGLGSLDELFTDEQKDEVHGFYNQLGLFAQSKGTCISVISIQGSDCSLENIGQLSELTAGHVDRVTPLEITKNFQSILSLPVLATHVSAVIMLHKGMDLRGEEGTTRDIGNVTKESGITFEYGFKKDFKSQLKNLKELPFQVQIRYTRMDGMKCMRCISKKQPITMDKVLAEEKADISVLGMNAVQQCGKLASKGDYSGARLYNVANKKMLSRAARSEDQQVQYSKWDAHGRKFETELAKAQMQEVVEGLDLEDDTDDKKGEAESSSRTKARRNNRSDSTSNMLYHMKSMAHGKFK